VSVNQVRNGPWKQVLVRTTLISALTTTPRAAGNKHAHPTRNECKHSVRWRSSPSRCSTRRRFRTRAASARFTAAATAPGATSRTLGSEASEIWNTVMNTTQFTTTARVVTSGAKHPPNTSPAPALPPSAGLTVVADTASPAIPISTRLRSPAVTGLGQRCRGVDQMTFIAFCSASGGEPLVTSS